MLIVPFSRGLSTIEFSLVDRIARNLYRLPTYVSRFFRNEKKKWEKNPLKNWFQFGTTTIPVLRVEVIIESEIRGWKISKQRGKEGRRNGGGVERDLLSSPETRRGTERETFDVARKAWGIARVRSVRTAGWCSCCYRVPPWLPTKKKRINVVDVRSATASRQFMLGGFLNAVIFYNETDLNT